jgi:hypothetical protein
MAEQRALVAQIKYQDPHTHTIIGKGLTTAYIVNALRDYFNDGTKTHYWEVDTTPFGSDYDIFTNAAPYDTTTNKHTVLVLKPVAGAPGGTAQRIVFITRGNNNPTGNVGWGGLAIGYLPDGTFDPTDGVQHDNAADFNNIVLSTAPTTWSTFRSPSSSTSLPVHLLNEFTVVEYRDDPAIHSDPGQSLFIALHTESTIDDYTFGGVRERVWTDRKTFKWSDACLVGRVIQPFTKYHEEAIGNKGDGIFTGVFDNQITLASRPMAEGGSTAAVNINDSSCVRVAPNCWALSFPHFGGLASSFFATDALQHNVGDWKQPIPIPIAGSPNNVVRNGLHVSTVNNFATYGYTKQLKQLPYSAGGWDGTWLTSDAPGSNRAWTKFPNNKAILYNVGRVLLWDKDGPQLLSYLQ